MYIIAVCILLLNFHHFKLCMDLIHLPIDERVSLDSNCKAHVVKTLNESVYATKANKRHKHAVFQPGDWVRVHTCKERFLTHKKSNLQP